MSVVELKTNRDLIDAKFEGYKLSLDAIPVLKQPINPGVKSFEPNVEEYSYIQMDKSSHFNHLFKDVWCPTCVFFLNKNNCICWCRLMEDGRLSKVKTVFQFPAGEETRGNTSLSFPDTDWAAVSNGNSAIYLLHTPSRQAGEPWTLCYTYSIPNCESSSYLLDSSYISLISRQQIDCLVMHFVKVSNDTEDKHSVNCIIEWLSFTYGHNVQEWSLKRTRRLAGTTSLLYCSLERNSCDDAVYLASEKEFKFVFDSELPLSATNLKEEVPASSNLYTYLQTPETVTVVFRLPEGIKAKAIKVTFECHSIQVAYQGTTVLEGDLCHVIDTSCSTWIVSGDRLELILCKAETALMWNELIKGDKRGEELLDAGLVEEIHHRLAHLTSETEVEPSCGTPFNLNQLEECDSCSEVLMLIRMDGNSHNETHRVHMGGHQWLFSCETSPKSLPVLCLRHDVDGVMWQPKNVVNEGYLDQLKMEHVSTFSALGYVQASKQDKKYTACTPDFRYAAIADCARHIYIYCQPENLNSALELRNRRTGENILHVAKQYVINLENCYHILGVCLSNECVFALSKDMLYCIKVSTK